MMPSINGNHQSGVLTQLRPSSGGTRGGSATAPRAADHTPARRAVIGGTVWRMVDHEPKHVQSDADRLIRLQALLGEAAVAYDSAHTDIDGEILHIAAAALAWLDARAREASE